MTTTHALRLGTAALAVSILGIAPAPAAAAPVSASASASAPIVQARLGNNVEAATLITNGRNAGQLAVLDGFAVRTVSVNGARTQPQTLFSIKDIAWPGFPSGIAYLSGEKTFAYVDQVDNDTLVITDGSGRQLPSRPIAYLPDSPALAGSEGLVYLGPDAAFPDSIARIVFDQEAFAPYIQVLGRDGTVRRDIRITGLSGDEFYPAGLTYLESGSFLVSGTAGIWHVGIDGAVVGEPLPLPWSGPEALVAAPNGRVYVADYQAAQLLAFNADLNRDPSRDRDLTVGVGLTRPDSGFWDPGTSRWVLHGIGRDGAEIIAAVTPDLASMQVLFHPPGVIGISSGPGGTIAACSAAAPRVDEYLPDGTLAGGVDFPAGIPQANCRFVEYVPSLDAYAVRLREFSVRHIVYLVSRTGELLRTIETPFDLVRSLATSPDGLVVYGSFAPGAGPEFAVLTYDPATGALLSTSTPDTGSLVQPWIYLTGPGGYAVIDLFNSEMAVFPG